MARTGNFTLRQTITEGKQAHICNPCSVVYSSYFEMGVVTNRTGLSSISAKQDLSKTLASKVGYVLVVSKSGVDFNCQFATEKGLFRGFDLCFSNQSKITSSTKELINLISANL